MPYMHRAAYNTSQLLQRAIPNVFSRIELECVRFVPNAHRYRTHHPDVRLIMRLSGIRHAFYRATLCYGSICRRVPVCLSVCLCVCVSVTLRYCIKTANHRIMQIKPHDSPATNFLAPKITAKFERHHSLRGRQMQMW